MRGDLARTDICSSAPKEAPDIEDMITAAGPRSEAEALKMIEDNLAIAKKSMETVAAVMQAARNLLAVLTPEGEVETLAAKKLADALGGKL